jgi:hypothetical protein
VRFGVQRQQTLLVTNELVIWRYASAFIFTNQSELDFGIAYVIPSVVKSKPGFSVETNAIMHVEN